MMKRNCDFTPNNIGNININKNSFDSKNLPTSSINY